MENYREYIDKLIVEELSKGEINSMINSKIEDFLQKQEFKKVVRTIIADVLEELYRALYQRKSFWQSAIK